MIYHDLFEIKHAILLTKNWLLHCIVCTCL